MEYTTISISKDLKQQILLLKVLQRKSTLEELLQDMHDIYFAKKQKTESKNKKTKEENK